MDGPYIIEHGDVWYREARESAISTGLRHVCDGSEELAVARSDGILHKAGSAGSVEAWAEKASLIVDDLEIIRFPVTPETVAELNAVVQTTGRVVRLEENLARIAQAHPGIAAAPRYPR